LTVAAPAASVLEVATPYGWVPEVVPSFGAGVVGGVVGAGVVPGFADFGYGGSNDLIIQNLNQNANEGFGGAVPSYSSGYKY